MLRIALCDDDSRQRDTLLPMLEAWQEECAHCAQITVFSAPWELLEAVKHRGSFDLYLLDVVMPGLNGIDLGLHLRENGDSGLIIYLTNSPDFAVDSYLVRAHNYLLKPLRREKLFAALNAAVAQLTGRRSPTITVRCPGKVVRIEIKQLLYAELYNRAVRYCLLDGRTVDSVSLREPFHTAVRPLLEEKNFILCGTSFAVNLEQAASVDKNGVTFKNGVHLVLSKKACSTLRSEWMNYWLEED